MREKSIPVFLVLLTTLLASPLEGVSQEEPSRVRPVSGLSVGGFGGSGAGVPHPASLALELWDDLQLTPEQVQQLREIEERMEREMLTRMAEVIGPTLQLPLLLWGEETLDEAELRSAAHRRADVEADLILGLFEARDEVFEVLTGEQRRQLLEVQRSLYSQPIPSDSLSYSSRPCLAGSASGGSRVSDRVELVYSVDFEGDSASIGAVFVGRADVKLYGSPGFSGMPEIPDGPDFLSGASMETWYMGYDEETHTAWVHTQRVPLGDANVVLVGGIDGLHELPRVSGLLKIPSEVFTGGCPPGRPWPEILLEELEKVPEIKDFIHPRVEGGA